MSRDRTVGALLGMTVGDALGTTYEFAELAAPAYPMLAVGPATDIVGGGPFGLVAGQITDDTQLAVCLARSLVDRGRLDVDDLARRFVAWRPHAFDIGTTTRAAIDRLVRGEPAATAGRSAWHDSRRSAAGNGSLMRIAPLAVWHGLRGSDPARDAVDESLVTHADPRCALACAGFCAAIADAVAGDHRDAERMLRRAGEAIEGASAYLSARWDDDELDRTAIDDAKRALHDDLAAARRADPELYSPHALHLHRTQGFVRVAFRLACWHAVHAPSYRAAVVDTASRGGDADTNAAIVGALLGARDGAATIPQAWRDRVLAATQPGPADWADAHHPRHLLALT
jgi:ADP-ribosylglycohydrolase